MADVWVGLDLGQLVDYSAMAILSRSLAIDEATGRPAKSSRGFYQYRYDILALRRFELGTPYASIVNRVVDVLLRPELGDNVRLCVDATGVGGPIVEMFRTGLRPYPRLECHAVTITAGRSWSVVGPHAYHCAKIELVAAVREVLELRRLKVSKRPDGTAMDHADVLRHELLNFRVKLTAAANETFNAREGVHDDLVLAVALPIWLSSLPRFELCFLDDNREESSLRPREQAAIAAESGFLAQLEESEVEALAIEGVINTRRVEAAREARFQRFLANPTADEWWNP
jgi:hypothetical protein